MSDYQIVKLEDVDDWLGDYPGEMRGITYAIGAEQVAITHRRMPQHTGSKGSYGHRHKTQEEIYFVLAGKLQFKLGRRDRRGRQARGDPGAAADLARGLERRARGRGARDRLDADRRPDGRHRERSRTSGPREVELEAAGAWHRRGCRHPFCAPVTASSCAAARGGCAPAGAAAERLDVRVAQNLDRG